LSEPLNQVDLHAPDDVRQIVSKLEAAGYQSWAVGGAVRDALRGGHPEDWDLTTAATPRDIQRVFPRTVPVGIAHGTVGVLAKSGEMYEVTTFRRDVETFGRHARVAFASTLEEDLSRRDFTINAIAWHPLTGELRDPHGGADDLRAGVLRTVGDPELRFREDRLRVLRALRFAGTLKLEIEAETWEAIVASSDKLGDLSAERIREELWKLLGGQLFPSRTLSFYAESGVLRALYPELDRCRHVPVEGRPGETLWSLTLRAVDAITHHRPLIRGAALFHATGVGIITSGGELSGSGIPPVGSQASVSPESGSPEEAFPTADFQAAVSPAGAFHSLVNIYEADGGPFWSQGSAAIARAVLRRLKASNADTDRVTHLIAQLAPLPDSDGSEPDIRRWVRRVGRECLNDLFRLLSGVIQAVEPSGEIAVGQLARLRSRVDAVRQSGVPIEIGELQVDGSDLRRLGVPPGPELGGILRELLELITDDCLPNQREELLLYVQEKII
jgi:tRNA nucleotidyltransferase/poly(A) polymerase